MRIKLGLLIIIAVSQRTLTKAFCMHPLRTSGILLMAFSVVAPFAMAAEPSERVVALKSGETVKLVNLFYVARCISLLKGPIVAEALEAPPGINVGVIEQDIVPHAAACAKTVHGGVLTVTADQDVKARVEGQLTVRVKYPTVDGERQNSYTFKVIVIPGK